MGSLAITTRLLSRPRRRELRRLPAGAAALALAVPYLVLAAASARLQFLPDFHANAIEKALVAVDRGRMEFIGLSYPPVPFVIAIAGWSEHTLSAITALLGGILSLCLWRQVSAAGVTGAPRALLVGSATALPSFLYVATQSVGEMCALLLFVLAWQRYRKFTTDADTVSGFMSGLLFGAAFFANFHALTFGLAYALLTPLFLEPPEGAPPVASRVAAAGVVAFPALAASASWAYLNWLFTGDAFAFVLDPAAPIRGFDGVGTEAFRGTLDLLRGSAAELARVPVYAVGAVIWVAAGRKRVLAYLAPAAVIVFLRAVGLDYPSSFAIVTLAVAALAALPVVRLPWQRGALTIAAVAQVVVGVLTPLAEPELERWQRTLASGRAADADRMEIAVAKVLTRAGRHQVLADDRSAYRLVARTGDAAAFLLPPDHVFPVAASAPERFVDYVLVATRPHPSDELARRYRHHPPPGFTLRVTWPGWRLYERDGAKPLVPR